MLAAIGVSFSTYVDVFDILLFNTVCSLFVHKCLLTYIHCPDGGDCCGHQNDYQYCKDCKCLDCTFEYARDKCVKEIKGFCGAAKFVGDGFCDDSNNNAGCSWDNGDCCGNSGKV